MMKKELIANLASAAVMLAVTLSVTVAHRLDYVDRDTVLRVVLGMTGLWMVWSGNRLPKTLVPVPANARQARRVAAWSQVLSGLVYTGFWAFAPIPTAVIGGSVAVVTGIAVTLGYCLSLRGKAKAA